MILKPSNRAIIYLRVSTEEQKRDMHGLESQERTCRDYCSERGWEVIDIYNEGAVSAFAPVMRPVFMSAIDFLKRNKDVHLVFLDYSRFGRKCTRSLPALEMLDSIGVHSVAATCPIDVSTAAGRTMRREECSKAEDFSDRNSENTSRRMKAAFDDGRCTRLAPLGYRNIPKEQQMKGCSNIEPEPTEAEFVNKAFVMVASGTVTPAKALLTLTALGLKSKRGNVLTLHTFLKMLKNPVYIGEMKSKKWHKTVKGKHQPIVDEHTFKTVQLILKGKKPVATPYQRNNPNFPLRGFLHCSECGHRLTAAPSKSETGRKYGYYRCYKCGAVKSTPSAAIESQFLNLLERLRPDPKMMSEFLPILESEWKSRTADCSEIVRRLSAELAQKKKALYALTEKYINGDRAVQRVFDDMSSQFEQDIDSLEAQIADAQQESATFQQLVEFSKSLLVDIASAWKAADIDQKQRVQNILFSNGLKYHPEKGILNSDKDCLFTTLEDFAAGKVSMARPERFELPTF